MVTMEILIFNQRKKSANMTANNRDNTIVRPAQAKISMIKLILSPLLDSYGLQGLSQRKP